MTPQSSLYFKESGPVDAPTILFLHGGGAGGWMWQPVVDLLPEYHCLRPDLPEHGGSQAVGPFRIDLAATEAAKLIEERAHAGVAHVVGLSEGGQVAVQMLAKVPHLLNHAVVSSALLRPLQGVNWLLSPWLLRWTYRLLMKPMRHNDAWIRLNMKYSAGIPDPFFSEFKDAFEQTTENGFVNLIIANQQFRLPPGLSEVRVPTLIVVGQSEYRAMKQSALDLAMALPNACVRQIRLVQRSSMAAEHNWALTAPDLFARTVRAWIAETDPPAQLRDLA